MIIVPEFPNIFIPRFLMADKPSYSAGTGKPLYGPTGKPAYCPECDECTPHCNSCIEANQADCPEGCCTPARWHLAVDEVVIVSTCHDCSPTDTASMENGVDPGVNNAAHLLTQDPDNACRWLATLGTGGVDADIGHTDCSSTGTVSAIGEIIMVRTTATNYTLLIQCAEQSGNFNAAIFFADGTGSATANRCDETINFNNGSSYICDTQFFGGEFTCGKDGSATATKC